MFILTFVPGVMEPLRNSDTVTLQQPVETMTTFVVAAAVRSREPHVHLLQTDEHHDIFVSSMKRDHGTLVEHPGSLANMR